MNPESWVLISFGSLRYVEIFGGHLFASIWLIHKKNIYVYIDIWYMYLHYCTLVLPSMLFTRSLNEWEIGKSKVLGHCMWHPSRPSCWVNLYPRSLQADRMHLKEKEMNLPKKTIPGLKLLKIWFGCESLHELWPLRIKVLQIIFLLG